MTEREGFMCRIDFEDELGHASDGNRIYPCIESLLEEHDCGMSCGIVKVRVELIEVVVEGTQ